MGLAGLATSWQRQTKHFGHDHGDTYTVLLIDNRGIGLSGAPLRRYSTSEMARDVLEVLDHLAWTAPRSVHVCGISLGGMISQELAMLIPDRLASLTLLCTSPDMETNKTLLSTLWARLGMFTPKPAAEAIHATAFQIFTDEFLAAPDEAKDVPIPGVTPMAGPAPGGAGYLTFDSNYQRFQAQELTKRMDKKLFSAKGFMMQLIAAAWHAKSPQQLAELGDRVGRERIAVVHGTRDNMIDVRFGRTLIERLQPGEGLILEGMGHAPVMERVDWFKDFFTERIEIGERENQKAAA